MKISLKFSYKDVKRLSPRSIDISMSMYNWNGPLGSFVDNLSYMNHKLNMLQIRHTQRRGLL